MTPLPDWARIGQSSVMSRMAIELSLNWRVCINNQTKRTTLRGNNIHKCAEDFCKGDSDAVASPVSSTIITKIKVLYSIIFAMHEIQCLFHCITSFAYHDLWTWSAWAIHPLFSCRFSKRLSKLRVVFQHACISCIITGFFAKNMSNYSFFCKTTVTYQAENIQLGRDLYEGTGYNRWE